MVLSLIGHNFPLDACVNSPGGRRTRTDAAEKSLKFIIVHGDKLPHP